MEKRGLVGWIILGIVFVILLGILLAAGYFYNFHVFKTVRVCIGEANDLQYPCEVVQDCIDSAEENGFMIKSKIDEQMKGAPEFLTSKFEEVIDKALYCEGTCHAREIRGINPETQEFEMLDNCEPGEDEVVIEIRGKEGLQIWNWMKNQGA